MSIKINALVPMKGHSERVTNKNIRLFCGKPLYRWVLDSLLELDCISMILIDTDSNIIRKDIENTYDTERIRCIDRPSFLLGDCISMNQLIAYDIDQLDCEYFIQTHATNPLTKPQTFQKAINRFVSDDDHDSLFSVNRLQTRLYTSEGKAINHNPEELIRTQDLLPIFEENSNIYLFTRESFNACGGRRIGKKPILFEMDPLESIDIDEESDFLFAEAIYSMKGNNCD